MENRFNLIDEAWIPVADTGIVSLRQLFSEKSYRTIGGTPVEKIAITKLLLAIAQAAYTPQDDDEWRRIGSDGLASSCLEYLTKWHDAFYLYGDKPFLQMLEINKAEIKSFGTVIPDVATGNTSRLTQYHVEKTLDDGQKALLLLLQMNFALGGKKTDNKIILSPSYGGKTNSKGKPTSGKPGPSLAHMGLLHSFAVGAYLQETLWLNLLTQENINEIELYSQGVGIAPWEKMPEGEDCTTAKLLKNSLMGRLVSLCRFCLLTDNGLHLTEGINHLSHKEGLFDPSITTKLVGKDLKVIWVDPERRPWRQLPALLGFIGQRTGAGDCFQLKYALTKAHQAVDEFGVWSGGIRVSSNAGEQYVSGKDDVLESTLSLPKNCTQKLWFDCYTSQMTALDTLAKRLYGSVSYYFKSLNKDGKDQASNATLMFWQLCERESQQLLNDCDDISVMAKLRQIFARYIQQTYDCFCPNQTARQLDAWAKSRPSVADYLK